jgi:trehalose 6-phosphate synthase
MDRFQAVARFFRENPSWIGKLVFVQVAAPTRAMLKRYREVQEETLTMVETINVEFGHDTWKPIILIAEQYNQRQVFELFRAADFCIVSSLHDGMNLVAKEFVAARDDERGVLILSPFAGAAEELQEALIVNPHDTKGMADSIFRALRMNPEEQTQRMRLLRNTVRERTIYWWAGQMLMDVARVRKSGVILTEPTLAGGLRDLLSPRRAIGKLLQLNKNARSRAA